MPDPSPLDNISIVLVDTRTPANIGASARCMMNMGLGRLLLVRPPEDRKEEARKLAAGADAILAQARVFSTLAEAVADHGLVLATSRHEGRRRKNIRSPREASKLCLPLLARNRIAIVFGNEVNGLDNEDLRLCHEIVSIPSSRAFPSLNLSHAVMVIAYELYLASLPRPADVAGELARTEETEHLYCHLQQTLMTIGFLDQTNSEHMMASFRQIFGRARLDERDVRILQGVLSAIDRNATK